MIARLGESLDPGLWANPLISLGGEVSSFGSAVVDMVNP